MMCAAIADNSDAINELAAPRPSRPVASGAEVFSPIGRVRTLGAWNVGWICSGPSMCQDL